MLRAAGALGVTPIGGLSHRYVRIYTPYHPLFFNNIWATKRE
jgi:hypothetical protein